MGLRVGGSPHDLCEDRLQLVFRVSNGAGCNPIAAVRDQPIQPIAVHQRIVQFDTDQIFDRNSQLFGSVFHTHPPMKISWCSTALPPSGHGFESLPR
jgi:hypothetical protein